MVKMFTPCAHHCPTWQNNWFLPEVSDCQQHLKLPSLLLLHTLETLCKIPVEIVFLPSLGKYKHPAAQ